MNLRNIWDKNGASILTGISVIGAISSGYLWYKAGPKVEEHRREWEERENSGEEVTMEEKIKDILPDVVLPACATAVTVGAAVGANVINVNNIAGMAILADKYKEHQKDISVATRKIVGDDKATEIEEEAKKRQRARVVEDAIIEEEDIFDTGTGSQLFIDEETGFKFRASRAFVQLCFERYKRKTTDYLGGYGYDGGPWSDFIEELGGKACGLARRNGLTPEEADSSYLRIIDDEYGVYSLIEVVPGLHNV